MLANIARFEFRYLLRNPLLWVTAAATFAMFFVAMSVDGFELGSEGGLLENAAYATLRNYLAVSVLFMFVTTSFVANVIIRDDETGFGPIVRSTRITKFEYLIGRFLGAFAIAALCMLLVPLAIWLGSLMPWADPATLGPNRLIDHLYGYFLIALPNILITSAIFFALATITRSMMATYLGVIGFVSGYFVLQKAFGDRPQLETAVAIAEPFGARALSDATRYWTAAERNVTLPDFTGALLYNRLLWIGISILCLALAYAAYRFADQGMSKRERKKQKLAQRASAEAPRVAEATSLPSPQHGPAALRALLWMRTRFEIKQVVLSPAFAVLMAWGLFVTFFVLITQRDPDGRPSRPLHRRAGARRLRPVARSPDGAPPHPLGASGAEVRDRQETDLRRRRSLQLLYRPELRGQRATGEVRGRVHCVRRLPSLPIFRKSFVLLPDFFAPPGRDWPRWEVSTP